MKAASPTTQNASRASQRSAGPVSPDVDVVIIGAGPYGLSAASYLKSTGVNLRVFGEPMDFWANKMPEGMLLRSPREASSISDPHGAFTLEAYESASSTQPAKPLPLDTFVRYGKWFQHQLGSSLVKTGVDKIKRDGSVFRAELADGNVVTSRRVVVAAGVGPFNRKPKVFQSLPLELASHCYEGRKVSELAGKRVAVIGAGQSALESAAILHEAGADVEIIAKIPELRWIGMHGWLHKMGPISKALYSKWDVGPIGLSRLVAYPRLMSKVPLGLRDKIRKRAVRPAGSRWLPARLTAVKVSTSRSVTKAEATDNAVKLTLDDGSQRVVDHVLMGTGYDVEISRYGFLDSGLVSSVQQMNGYPVLSRGFSCSVPGLHFIGATAARSFGPLLYFVAGTEFASNELTSYLSKQGVRSL